MNRKRVFSCILDCHVLSTQVNRGISRYLLASIKDKQTFRHLHMNAVALSSSLRDLDTMKQKVS